MLVRRRPLHEWIVPAALQVFLFFGAFLAVYHAGIGWIYLHEHKPYTAIVYSTSAICLLGTLAYVHAVLSLQEPPSPPEEIPDQVKERLVVFECIDQNGEVPKCQKGACKGRWKPSRTHHCSTCGKCRLGFDHHCLWLGNCVTTETRKMFLFLTGGCSLTILALSSVVIRPVWGHVNEALRVSYANPYANDMWWHRWYSWVLVAGPFGRWPVGVAYGYVLLARQSQPSLFGNPGSLITEPSITLYVVLLVANALSLFTLGLFLFTFRDVLRGRTTLERLMPEARARLLWVPRQENLNVPAGVISCSPIHNPYDRGMSLNWRDLTQRPLFGALSRNRDVFQVINLSIVVEATGAHEHRDRQEIPPSPKRLGLEGDETIQQS